MKKNLQWIQKVKVMDPSRTFVQPQSALALKIDSYPCYIIAVRLLLQLKHVYKLQIRLLNAEMPPLFTIDNFCDATYTKLFQKLSIDVY